MDTRQPTKDSGSGQDVASEEEADRRREHLVFRIKVAEQVLQIVVTRPHSLGTNVFTCFINHIIISMLFFVFQYKTIRIIWLISHH